MASRRGWLGLTCWVGTVALAACHGSNAASTNSGTAPASAGPGTTSSTAPASQPTGVIGQASSLTGATSSLSGTVSGFEIRETTMARILDIQSDTLFDFDKADLNAAAATNLTRAATILAAVPKGAISVIGHTDAKGDADYNQRLSVRRAEAVTAWLRRRPDLSGLTFTAIGKGETEPVKVVPDTASDAERAPNRRVQIIIPK